jgi:hypothetical protein
MIFSSKKVLLIGLTELFRLLIEISPVIPCKKRTISISSNRRGFFYEPHSIWFIPAGFPGYIRTQVIEILIHKFNSFHNDKSIGFNLLNQAFTEKKFPGSYFSLNFVS